MADSLPKASASKMLPNSLTVFIGIVSITKEIISGICIKLIFLFRKAPTASSLAAFHNVEAVPPEIKASLAILMLGNLFKSGREKFNWPISSNLRLFEVDLILSGKPKP